MSAVLVWWRSLATRERILVGAALLLAALTLAQTGARFARGALDGLRAEVASLRESERIALALAAAPNATAAGSEPLLAGADAAARRAGLGAGMKRLSQDPDGRVKVRFESVALADVARFIAELEARTGARVEALLIARSDGRGLVDVALTLAAGGA